MSERISILDHLGENDGSGARQPLGAVKLSKNQIAVVLFHSDVERVPLHYCDFPDLQSYVHCNKPTCALCSAGRGIDERFLLPVYLPTSRTVAVLPISANLRPGALLPQLLPHLRSARPVALLISKPDNAKFIVCAAELTEGQDDGAAVIKLFVAEWEAGHVDLASVFPRLDNRTLAEIPEISEMLKFKGVTLDEHGNPR